MKMQRLNINISDITGSRFTWKSACAVATTANINVSNFVGTTIDGYVVQSGDRVLAKNQTITSENGVYVSNAKAVDSDISPGFGIYYITNGSVNGGLFYSGTTGFTFSNAPINGTVRSVALTMPSIFSVSGSPITTIGTLATTLVSQSQNLVFASPSGSSGTPTFRSIVNADLTNSTIGLSIGTSGSDVNISGSPAALGGAITLNIPSADTSVRGVITTTAQNIGGQKTFTTAPILQTLTQGSILFIGASSIIAQSNSQLFWDNTNSRLGIGTATPSTSLHINGSARLTGSLADSANSVGTAGQFLSSTGSSIAWASPYPTNLSFASESAVTVTTNYPSYTNAAVFAISALTSGTYRIEWYAEFGTIANSAFAQLTGSVSGVLANSQNNSTSAISSINFLTFSGFKILSTYTGSENITFQLANSVYTSSDPATIQRMRLVVQRIN